jgi:hypothetical protein
MSTATERRSSPAVLATWVDFDPTAADEIGAAFINLLADMFVVSLAHVRATLPRLSLDAGRASRSDLRDDGYDALNESERSAAGLLHRSGTFALRQRLMDSHGGELSQRTD